MGKEELKSFRSCFQAMLNACNAMKEVLKAQSELDNSLNNLIPSKQ